MTIKPRQTLIATAVALALSPAMAGEIQSINTFNFGPVTDPATPAMPIYDRAATEAGALTYGVMGWDVLKAVEPGIAVYNNVPAYGTNQIIADCVMAPRLPALAGDPDKACNDGFQTHKRYKMSATGIGPIDLVFTVKNGDAYDQDGNLIGSVVDQDGTLNIYRMIGKLNNHTGQTLGGFTVQLGFGIGNGFFKSKVGDGLKFSLTEEDDPADSIVPVPLADTDIAEFPGGLFYGPADSKHDIGFFSDTRAGFTVDTAALATEEDFFGSITLSTNYSALFGKWLPIDQVPQGWFFDHDGDPATDAVLTAWDSGTDFATWTDNLDWKRGFSDNFAAVNPVTEGWTTTQPTVYDNAATATYATWNTSTGVYDLAAGGTMTNEDMTTLIADTTDPLELVRVPGYVKGPIEDLANVNLNYFVEIGDTGAWPTYDATSGTYSFTLRITPVSAAATELPPPASETPPATGTTLTATGGGGGCAHNPNAPFSPTMPLLTLAALGGLFWRLRRKQAQ